MPDTDAIIAGLSDAQKANFRVFSNGPCSAFDKGYCSTWVPEQLRRLGLLQREGNEYASKAPVTDYYYSLSPLGQAVRKQLEKTNG